MSKAIVSVGAGTHARLLEIALPSYQGFAKRHGWDLYTTNGVGTARPPAWYKLRVILDLLNDYDEVLLLDADTVIVDGRDDLTAPPEAWQAMVMHHTGDGEVPNTGVWLTRKPMIEVIRRAWGMTRYLMHGWWEQAALLDLMGYQVEQPTHLIEPTELYRRTHWLDTGWNVHKWHAPRPEHPRIQHATMYQDRVEIMRIWAAQAEEWLNE